MALCVAGCPAADDGTGSTSGPGDSSSGPGSATSPDPSMSSTLPGGGDGTATSPPGGSSGSDTGAGSSTGGEPGATPCQGKAVVHIPEVTRVASHLPGHLPRGASATPGSLQHDVDPIEGGSGSTDDGGLGFLDQPDGGGMAFECDPIAQDCPAGEKCAPWASDGSSSWNATRCVPVAPDPGAPGDPCTVEGSGVSGLDDCELGALCFGVDDNGMGTCIEMCSGTLDNPTCDTPATTCIITNQGALTLCQPLCNPLADECAPDEGCYLAGDFTVCAPDASGRMGGTGSPCEYINACDDGHACAAAESVPGCAGATGCCTPFCTVGDDSACMAGQTCAPVYPKGEAPLECVAELGMCMAP